MWSIDSDGYIHYNGGRNYHTRVIGMSIINKDEMPIDVSYHAFKFTSMFYINGIEYYYFNK